MAGREKSEWLQTHQIARVLKSDPSLLKINASKVAKSLSVSPSTISRHLNNLYDDYEVTFVPKSKEQYRFSAFVEISLEKSSKEELEKTADEIREAFGSEPMFYLPGEEKDILYLLRAQDAEEASNKIFAIKDLSNVEAATMVYVILEER